MMIKPVTEEYKEAFNKAASHPLQSWEWGEFRKKTGNEIVRLAVFEGKKLTDAIQITLHPIPPTPFKVGALIKGPKPTPEILAALKDLAKQENLIFTKIEPNFLINIDGREIDQKGTSSIINLLKKSGGISGRRLFTKTSFWINLTPPEEDLLKGLSSKTRYNIRLAQKHGVEVVEDNSDKAFEKYISLTKETVQRQGFYAHTERYHRLMWEVLHKNIIAKGEKPIARLLTARYKREIITCWIVFVWHDFLYYPYGASTEKYKNVMANNLIMWEAIRYGKKLGLKTFDLWGREEGKGFTKFKEGYNPKIVEFLGTWDLITSPLYWPYRAAESLRWTLLRLKSKFVKPSF